MVSGDYVPHAPGYVDSPGTKIVTQRFGYDDSYTLERYEAPGGSEGLKTALAKSPDRSEARRVGKE